MSRHVRAQEPTLDEFQRRFNLARFVSFQERALEKQRSRDEDARRLAAGEVTREQLRRENGHFSFLGEVTIDIKGAKPLRPKMRRDLMRKLF